MQKVGKSLHWDKYLRVIRIFGAPSHREQTKQDLEQFCRELQTLEKNTVVLDRNKMKEWGTELETFMKQLQVEHNINKKSCQMDYWVDTTSDTQKVKVLQGVLVTKQWQRERAPLVTEGTCCLCMCDFDADTYQFQACRHRFCTGCLRNAFSDPDGAHFPIRCPFAAETGRCDSLVVWKDIVGLVSSEVLARMKSIAIDAYVRENPSKAVYCPHPACNHVLQPLPAQGGESHCGGSLTAFCEVCNTAYCLACSEDAHLPVPRHVGQSCVEARRAGNPDIKKHRDAISQILTLKCPRCSRAFLDYSGCAAVTCDACGCGFCAKCFKDSQCFTWPQFESQFSLGLWTRCTSTCLSVPRARYSRPLRIIIIQTASKIRTLEVLIKMTICQDCQGIRQVSQSIYLTKEEFDRLNLEVAKLRILEYLDDKAARSRRSLEIVKMSKKVGHRKLGPFLGFPKAEFSFFF